MKKVVWDPETGRARINPPENMTLSDLSAGKQERFTLPSIAQAKSVRRIP